MKVAIVSVFPPYRGGIARFNQNLHDALIADGHEVLAINFKRQYPGFMFPGKTQFTDETPDPNIEPVMDTLSIRSWWRTAARLNDSDFDTVIVPFWTSYLVIPKIGFIKRLKKKRVIALAHNAIPHDARSFQKNLAHRFFNACDAHITLSSAVTNDLLSLCSNVHPAQVIELFHPVYPSQKSTLTQEAARQKLQLDPTKKVLLYFGLIRPYKGLEILVEAMEKLSDDYQLLIAGEPYYSIDELISASARQGDRIKWHTHFIPDQEVADYFKAADALVLPYRNATQSGVTAMAIYHGTPALVSDVGGLSEYVDDGKTGVLFKPNDAVALASAVQRWFDFECLTTDVNAAIALKAKQLSWAAFVEQLTARISD